MRQKIQIVLILGIVAAAIRLGWILYERHENATQQASQQAVPLNPDYYVTPKKLYPYDLKSARQLTQQPVWVKVGYRYTYFTYQPARRHVDFGHDAGLLGPIEKLAITDVVVASNTVSGQAKQIVA